ncbi:4'-phosphopantetheinyl transferase family protein [Aestuariispira ectoiniformans]|uniref:4'-phosphopantetheinyl transferase family protein n=1 Tax=Aestuariispira ectoiniformans TaxID=2775080 RepID=UPI00223B45DA|nr:4'-phosphopantetheinyl transferase superfamily protein [Aestuariispira ectoiniformans]
MNNNLQPFPWPSLPDAVKCKAIRFNIQDLLAQSPGVALPAALTKAVPKRRAEFLAGRLCAKEALRNLLDEEFDIPIATDRSPVWPAGTIGSISHTSDIAVAMVASDREYWGLGVDCEAVLDRKEASELAHMILAPEEPAAAPARLSLAQFITLAFSAKEALYKAVYKVFGPTIGFHDATISAIGQNQLTLCLTALSPTGNASTYPIDVKYKFEENHVLTWLTIDHGHPVAAPL